MTFPLSSFVRQTVLLAVCALSLVTTACRRAEHPNVLVITIDTLRADHLGCYGYSSARTPNIDRLASEGVRCTNATAAAPITMPSHTSIFTGLLPPRHGVRDNGSFALDERAVTLAERLRDAGYTTHAFVSAIVLSRRYNLDQGFETYDDDLWAENEPKLFMIRERPAARTAGRFLSWLSSWSLGANRKPFFTWIHFFDPHQPYDPPAEDRDGASPYDGEIASVDRQIGRVLAALEREGVAENTIVVLTADHGESLGEHGEKTHAVFVYDATVHVPLIVRDPRLHPSTYRGAVRSVDIVPTLLARLRLPGGESTDGVDLNAAFRGRVAPPHLLQYSESLLSELGFGFAPLYAVRDGNYKWIRAPKPELYDLARDPHELNNLYSRERRIASRLDGELTTLLVSSRAGALKSRGDPVSRETQETLQALGYLAPAGERTSMGGIDPKDGMPIYQKLEDARHLAQQSRWDEANLLLHEILDVTPRNVSAINVLGLVSMRQQHFDEAVSWYRRSLAIDPAQFRVLGVLGGIALTEGNLDEAERGFTEAVRANDAFAEGWANLGFIEAIRGNETRAEELYRKGIAADPTYPRVQRRLADLYYLRGDFSKARSYYEAAVTIVPSDAQAVIQAGNSARRSGDATAARRWFNEALRLRSGWWVPSYNLACLDVEEGKTADAIAHLKRAIHDGLDLSQFAGHDPDLAPLESSPEFGRLLRSSR